MKIIILDTYFEYGTAGANRQLSYAKGFQSQGIETWIVSFCVHRAKGYIPDDGIKLLGLLATRIKGPKIVRGFVAVLSLIWFLVFKVSKDDKLLVCGSEFYFPLILFFKRDNIYYEITEGPGVINKSLETSKLYLHYCNKFNRIFPICTNLKKWFLERGIPESKLAIINMTVDHSRFNNIKKDQKEKYIAYCGSVGNVKDGVDKLLEAFYTYHKEIKDRKLYIIGPVTSEKIKKEYENYVHKHMLDDFVVFTGAVLPTDMPKLLCNAEMLLLTRPNNEQAHYGFPTKLGEYLLTENPVIVSNVGNIADFLEDNISAYIITPDDIEAFTNKMVFVSTHLNDARTVGKLGAECARKNFNYKIEASKILKSMDLRS